MLVPRGLTRRERAALSSLRPRLETEGFLCSPPPPALGAETGRVQRLIIRQGMVLTVIAVVPGLAAAWMVAKLFTSVLYGVAPHDLAIFTLVPLFLIAVALLACWIPSRRAASAEPLIALRHE